MHGILGIYKSSLRKAVKINEINNEFIESVINNRFIILLTIFVMISLKYFFVENKDGYLYNESESHMQEGRDNFGW